MAEAVNRIDISETFLRQSSREIFPANSIDAMASERFFILVDEQVILIQGFGLLTVFFDISFEELGGFRPDFYHPISISLTEYGEGVVLRVKIIDLKGRDLGGPGS